MPKTSTTKLTLRFVKRVKPDETVEDGTFYWDSQLKGFGLRVYASGRKVFVYQYRHPVDRGTRRMKLEVFPKVTLDQARTLALSAAERVAKGEDPDDRRSRERERLRLSDVFPLYLAERRGKVQPRTIGEYERLWSSALQPTFGTRLVPQLSEEHIARWHSSRASTPAVANRAVDLLSSFCSWAERRGYRPRHTNPCVEVERFPEQRRSRSLSADEYAVLGAALRAAEIVGLAAPPEIKARSRGVAKSRAAKSTGKSRGAYAKRAPYLRPAALDLVPANAIAIAAIRFLALSGWRGQEVLSLRWDAVNFERGVAVLLKTKTGRSERPLGQAALNLLGTLPRLAGSPWVFPGADGDKHLVDIKRLWQTLKFVARLEESIPLRLHDLRHSFTTVARDELGLGDHVIAHLIGHKLEGMTSRYGEVRDRTIRRAADDVAQLIKSYLGLG
jgi:integrase